MPVHRLALLLLQAEQLTQLSQLQARTAALEQQNQQLQQELRRVERETAGLSGGGGGSGNVSVLIGGADDGGAGPPAQLLPRPGGPGAGATGAFGGSRPVSGGARWCTACQQRFPCDAQQVLTRHAAFASSLAVPTAPRSCPADRVS